MSEQQAPISFAHALAPWTCAEPGMPVIRGYETAGGGATPIHFLHGNGFAGGVYSPFLAGLYQRGHGLVMPDCQGHGASDAGARFIGWEATARRAARVMDARLPGTGDIAPIGAGHSFGGIITLLMAAREPARFSRVVLLDPVLFPRAYVRIIRILNWLGVARRITPMARQAMRRNRRWASREAARESMCERGIFRGWAPEALDAYVHYALHCDDSGCELSTPAWMEASIFSSAPPSLWRAVRRVRVPVDIVVGRETYDFILPSVQRAARLNQHIRVHTIAGGHCFMQQAPGPAADFVAGLLAADPASHGAEAV